MSSRLPPGAAQTPAVKFSLYYAVLFVLFGVYWPYFPTWLESTGLTVTQVGFVLSIAYWSRMAAAPLIALTTTRIQEPKFLLAILVSVSFLGFSLYLVVNGFWAIALVTVLSAGALHTALPFGEALAVQSSKRGLFDYGQVRLWGSVTFIIANMIGASLVGVFGPGAILYWVVGVGILLILITVYLPATPREFNERRPERIKIGEIISALTRPRILVFLLSASLIQASHAVYYAFSIIDWRADGMAEPVIGAVWALGVVAEIVLFAIAGKRLGQFRAEAFLILGGVCAIVRWLIMALDPAFPVLVLTQLLHAFTFGATHLAVMKLFAERIPSRLGPAAQSFNSALSMGALMGLATLIGTRFYETAGWIGYGFMAVIGAVGLAGGLCLFAGSKAIATEKLDAHGDV